jgi:hypothetical protein
MRDPLKSGPVTHVYTLMAAIGRSITKTPDQVMRTHRST